MALYIGSEDQSISDHGLVSKVREKCVLKEVVLYKDPQKLTFLSKVNGFWAVALPDV